MVPECQLDGLKLFNCVAALQATMDLQIIFGQVAEHV